MVTSGCPAHRLISPRVALLDFVRDASAKLGVPGVGLALIDHGEIVFEGGVGVRELGRPELVDAHTRFMVGSNTKGMTTLLLARLVDQGKLHWDDPVTEVYPAFRLGSDETTRQVLVRHLVSASRPGCRARTWSGYSTRRPKHRRKRRSRNSPRPSPPAALVKPTSTTTLAASAAATSAFVVAYRDQPLGEAWSSTRWR